MIRDYDGDDGSGAPAGDDTFEKFDQPGDIRHAETMVKQRNPNRGLNTGRLQHRYPTITN